MTADYQPGQVVMVGYNNRTVEGVVLQDGVESYEVLVHTACFGNITVHKLNVTPDPNDTEIHVSGPVGPFRDRAEFEKLLPKIDECLSYEVPPRQPCFSGQPPTIVFYHYFYNGLELAYWCPITTHGYLLEKPREWYPPWKAALIPRKLCLQD